MNKLHTFINLNVKHGSNIAPGQYNLFADNVLFCKFCKYYFVNLTQNHY